MLRIAKPLNFVPVSPSVQQRAKYGTRVFLGFLFVTGKHFSYIK